MTKNRKFIITMIGLLMFTFLINFVQLQWKATPQMVFDGVYEQGYLGSDTEATALSNIIKELRNKGYSKPQARCFHKDGTWKGFIDFYLYSPEDGSVMDTKVLWVIFEASRNFKDIFHPKFTDVLEFGGSEAINGN